MAHAYNVTQTSLELAAILLMYMSRLHVHRWELPSLDPRKDVFRGNVRLESTNDGLGQSSPGLQMCVFSFLLSDMNLTRLG